MSEVLSALRDTRLMMALRLRSVRSSTSRLWMAIGLVLAVGAVMVASNAGDILRMVVFGGASTDAGQLLLTALLADWVRDDFAAITAVIVIGALGISVASAAVTASPGTMLPEADRAFMRPTTMSRFFESIVSSAVSVVVVVQLVALTGLASLLTMDSGGTAWALVIAWSLWGLCQAVFLTALWGSQVLRRTQWTRRKVLVALGLASGLLAGAVSASGLFVPAGAQIASVIADTGPGSLAIGAGLLVLSGAFGWAAWGLCAKALGMHSRASIVRSRKRRSIPKSYMISQLDLQVRSLLRMRAITDPVIALMGIAWVATLILGPVNTVAWAVGLGIPLVVALAYSRNALAVVGPSGAWLSSLPGGGSTIPVVMLMTGFGLSVLAGVAAWLPATVVLGLWADPMLWSSLLTVVLASALMTSTSILYALRHPSPARINSGEAILSPGVAIVSILRLLVFSGLLSWLATSGSAVLREDDAMLGMGTQVSLTAGGVALSVLISYLIHSRWQDQGFRARALAGAA